MGKNDIVSLMSHDLADLCELRIVDTDIYGGQRSGWFQDDFRYSRRNPVRWLDHERALSLVSEYKPEFVIVNSGGMSLHQQTIHYLREKNILCIGISLSDPDVFPYHGRIYSHLYDIYYTNSVFSIKSQYSKHANVKLLPFAASPRLHRPLPGIEKVFDIVVVGHARADRIKIVDHLMKHFSVGVFGNGWGGTTAPVHGEEHVRAINSGRMYLSFSKTGAGYFNIKVGLFEAAACKTFLISEYFGEMERYYKYGLEVVGYRQVTNLVRAIDYYLEKQSLRDWIAQNAYDRCLREHTWHSRWKAVLSDITNSRLNRTDQVFPAAHNRRG